tara:strand:- start:571 stop:876 length:306 start_codon:yes stop_codon:yes gene_type:complete
MTNLYMGGEDLPDDYTDENGAEYSVEKEDKRMYENHKDHGQDMSYENEVTRDSSPYVRISVDEYNKLRDQGKYITDPALIGAIDKIEFFIKELRKHIVRKY